MELPCGFGRYTLVERMACGGTAEIYRATLESAAGFRKDVAIKRLLPEWRSSAEFARMLEDEGRVLCHLAHQSIVQVYDMGVEQGLAYLAMEFVHGVDCARVINCLIRDGVRMPAHHALHLMGQVLTALAFAHSARDSDGRELGVIHRDISPSNVLVSFQGEVKLADFGIAKGAHRTERTEAGRIRGKHCYMSPEQARGEGVDVRTDIFACGIVLYELLTSRRLFGGACDYEILRRVAEGGFGLDGASDLPGDVLAILDRALACDRRGRYPSADEMLRGLVEAAHRLESPGSSVELARFVRELFPEELARERCIASSTREGARTRVMSQACPVRDDRLAGRLSWRAAAMVALLVGTTAPAAPRAFPTRAAEPVAAVSQETPARSEGAVEEGPPPPARISVSANPWGLISVQGYVSAREAPLIGLRVRPGPVTVTALHPPSGRRASRSVVARSGRTLRCVARFGRVPVMSCR